ncbi:hypothetical protein XELAEV_18000452mg [Xenopus laevis]|uniref:Uncharacterized protein n=1 Tax=Xenopus laevis TaxID=8355 RepID=A0A974BQG4_XENLA|nr:hypothetical protein XELAEV_18000452mg [Xenopus laevis]
MSEDLWPWFSPFHTGTCYPQHHCKPTTRYTEYCAPARHGSCLLASINLEFKPYFFRSVPSPTQSPSFVPPRISADRKLEVERKAHTHQHVALEISACESRRNGSICRGKFPCASEPLLTDCLAEGEITLRFSVCSPS